MVHTYHMQLKITTLGKFFAAYVTVVRFLARMRSIMLLQQVLETESFRANIAGKSSFVLAHGNSFFLTATYTQTPLRVA